MTRPIPEGVRVCTEHGPGFHPYCPACAIDSGRLPIAAPADSEVARLNACPDPSCTDGQTWVTDLEGQPQRKDCGCQNAPDKDALIRELVESLQQWEDALTAAICHLGVHIELVSEVAQASRKGFDVLTLARTTCPEAFDE